MKKTALFVIVVFTVNCVFSQVDRDKALHFLGGNLYGLAGAGIAKQISKGNRWWTFAGAVGGSTLIGLGKEAVDSGQSGNGWDNDDLLATILGGTTVGITIDLFTNHKRERPQPQENLSLTNNKNKFDQYVRLDKLLKEHRAPTLLALSLPKELFDLN